MADINNKPKKYIEDPEATLLRGAIEHRATWMYLLMDEARKQDLDWDDFARKAIFRCGHFHGENKIKANCSEFHDLEKFYPVFLPETTAKALEAEVLAKTPNYLQLDFHYCPLVAAWQKLGCTPDEIAHLCDIAMDGDRGIAEECGLDITIEKKIAEGDDTCRLSFRIK